MDPVLLVTGGSGGIGRQIALSFAQNGYRVALAYHKNEKSAYETVSVIRRMGADAEAFCADIASPLGAEMLVKAAVKRFSRVDTLINNAGIAQQKLFIDLSEEDWRRIFAVDVDAAFYCTKAALTDGGMLARKSGCIINISSIWGLVGASCEVHYSAAKAALIGMTKALAKELGPSGIRVNCVAPGVIDTPMNAGFSKETMEELTEQTPLMRLGTPLDAAKSCLFLAGEGGSFYTGQVLSPCGGIVI